jgi:hypothetical protein
MPQSEKLRVRRRGASMQLTSLEVTLFECREPLLRKTKSAVTGKSGD